MLILNVLLAVSVASCSKVKVFNDFDFNKGGYTLLGTFSENSRNTLRDSLGEFYTDDIEVLNQFKKIWEFSKRSQNYACGYHYNIYLCYQGEVVLQLRINLECEEITFGGEKYYFNSNLLRQFYGKLKSSYSHEDQFSTLLDARDYYKKIVIDTNLIMAPQPPWIEFEGYFGFTYKYQVGTKDFDDEEEQIFKAIESDIKTTYPGEPFSIEKSVESLDEITFRITCNKTLAESFNLHGRIPETYPGKWSPFDFRYLKTYWKTDKNESAIINKIPQSEYDTIYDFNYNGKIRRYIISKADVSNVQEFQEYMANYPKKLVYNKKNQLDITGDGIPDQFSTSIKKWESGFQVTNIIEDHGRIIWSDSIGVDDSKWWAFLSSADSTLYYDTKPFSTFFIAMKMTEDFILEPNEMSSEEAEELREMHIFYLNQYYNNTDYWNKYLDTYKGKIIRTLCFWSPEDYIWDKRTEKFVALIIP